MYCAIKFLEDAKKEYKEKEIVDEDEIKKLKEQSKDYPKETKNIIEKEIKKI